MLLIFFLEMDNFTSEMMVHQLGLEIDEPKGYVRGLGWEQADTSKPRQVQEVEAQDPRNFSGRRFLSF